MPKSDKKYTQKDLSKNHINSIYGYNDKVTYRKGKGYECPLSSKIETSRLKIGEQPFWNEKGSYVNTRVPIGTPGVDRMWLTTSVHRIVALMVFDYDNITEFDQVDHKDNCKTNNLAGNLRVVTNGQNARNNPYRGGTSIYRGVQLTPSGRWSASAKFNKKAFYIGIYDDEITAAIAYDRYLFNRFGREGILEELFQLNFPETYGIRYDTEGVAEKIPNWVPPPPDQNEFDFHFSADTGDNTHRIYGTHTPKEEVLLRQLNLFKEGTLQEVTWRLN